MTLPSSSFSPPPPPLFLLLLLVQVRVYVTIPYNTAIYALPMFVGIISTIFDLTLKKRIALTGVIDMEGRLVAAERFSPYASVTEAMVKYGINTLVHPLGLCDEGDQQEAKDKQVNLVSASNVMQALDQACLPSAVSDDFDKCFRYYMEMLPPKENIGDGRGGESGERGPTGVYTSGSSEAEDGREVNGVSDDDGEGHEGSDVGGEGDESCDGEEGHESDDDYDSGGEGEW